MLVKFWGVHGSLPRPGFSTLKYGGNTPCVEIRSGKTLVIFDAGTGIRELGEDISRRQKLGLVPKTGLTGHIFFSHLHWDHVQGFPFFSPTFHNNNEFHLYAGKGLKYTIYRLMDEQMNPPNFPICLDDLTASIFFHDLHSRQEIRIDEVVIQTEALNHPGGCFGYRLESNGKVIVYASDNEILGDTDPRVVELARKADVLIHDGMFTPEQYFGIGEHFSRQCWGHSTWKGAVKTALAAGVKHLILFHHGNDDETVGEIEMKAGQEFPMASAAREGMEIDL